MKISKPGAILFVAALGAIVLSAALFFGGRHQDSPMPTSATINIMTDSPKPAGDQLITGKATIAVLSNSEPHEMGRTSIKNVFPALTGGSYEGMEIGGGGVASVEFARITFSDGVGGDEKDRVRKSLEAYCKLDTQAMIDILKVLRGSVKL